MDLWVIRHTRTRAGRGICYGQREMPLAESFPVEAEAIGKRLPRDLDRLISSPLRRCRQLAQTLAGDLTVEIDERLQEVHFGEWEGRPWNEIALAELQPWMDDFVTVAPPGGESFAQLLDRTAAFLEDLRSTGKKETLAVITHAGVIRAMWGCVLGIPPENLFRLAVPEGSLHRFQLAEDPRMDQAWGEGVLKE